MARHQTLEEFLKENSRLSQSQFLIKYPAPLLEIDFKGILSAPKEALDQVEPPSEGALTQFTLGHDDKLDEIIIAPLEKSNRNPMQNAVTLGRAITNDIIIPHGVISKLHAILKKETNTGQYSIADIDSKYGTTVNQYSLPPTEAYPLTGKPQIVFAKYIRAVFYSPKEFHQHMHFIRHLYRGDTEA
jgi:pSer/pThr/pTyr-binding forkhead associated (FHA) protein